MGAIDRTTEGKTAEMIHLRRIMVVRRMKKK